MTLLVTKVSFGSVVQVSDCRISSTTDDGTIKAEQDFAVKSIVGNCQNARYCLAYTGVAGIEGRRTDNWLADHLHRIGAPTLKMSEILNSVQSRVVSTVAPLRARLSLVFAGYKYQLPLSPENYRYEPFLIVLTNYEDRQTGKPGTGQPEFWWYGAAPAGTTSRHRGYALMTNGAEEAVNRSVRRRLQKTVRSNFLISALPNEIADRFVSFVRHTASDARYGERIGKNCISIEFDPDPRNGAMTRYHSEKEGPVSYLPHLVTANGTLRNVRVKQEPDSTTVTCYASAPKP